jgi:nitrite reductase/ring-hydroxylating ferredoxin subunit
VEVSVACHRCGRREFLLSVAALGVVQPLEASGGEATYRIPSGDGATIDQQRQVILVREGTSVYAFTLSCPHENTALRWKARERRFQCPRHESKYQLNGTFLSGRATRNIDRFPVKRQGDSIAVDLTHVFHSDEHKAEWDAAVVRL